MKNAIKISLIHVGILVGAGFASGQEFHQFFLKYGRFSIFAVTFVSLFFGFALFLFLERIRKNRFTNSVSYFGNGKLAFFVQILTTFFMLGSYTIMIAAAGSIAEDIFGVNKLLGIIAFSFICLLIFLKKEKGIIWLNSIVTPVIIFGLIFLGFTNINLPFDFSFNAQSNGLMFSTFLYISYNCITTIPVLIGVNDLIKARSTSIFAGIFSGISMLLISTCIWMLMAQNYNLISTELPIFAAIGSRFKILYIFIFVFAIVTTATSSGFGFLNNTKFFGNMNLLFLMLCGIIVSTFGFSSLVSKLYSFFGIFGFVIFLPNIGNNAFNRRNHNEKTRKSKT